MIADKIFGKNIVYKSYYAIGIFSGFAVSAGILGNSVFEGDPIIAILAGILVVWLGALMLAAIFRRLPNQRESDPDQSDISTKDSPATTSSDTGRSDNITEGNLIATSERYDAIMQSQEEILRRLESLETSFGDISNQNTDDMDFDDEVNDDSVEQSNSSDIWYLREQGTITQFTLDALRLLKIHDLDRLTQMTQPEFSELSGVGATTLSNVKEAMEILEIEFEPEEEEKRIRWIIRAAEEGDSEAQYDLG
jgi:hypothetical protein